MALIEAQSGHHVALDNLPQAVLNEIVCAGVRNEDKPEVERCVQPFSFLPESLRLVFVAETDVVRALLRLGSRDTLPVSIGDTLWLSLDDER